MNAHRSAAAEATAAVRAPRTRVCFLYIAQAHQALHSLSVAIALARSRPDIAVDVAATSEGVLDYVRLVAHLMGGAPLDWRLLGPGWLRALRGTSGLPPKLAMLAANAHALSRYDVIVTPERTTVALRQMGVQARLVYTQHGAGDRAGPFEPRLAQFDLVFAAGHKQRDRMVSTGLVAPDRCAVVGYPKFDLVDRMRPPLPALFANCRPIVLYNPHFLPSLSSWPLWGLEVLRAFADQERYNLIFAPHLRLFAGRRPGCVRELTRFVGHPGIHIDLGGTSASIDMTYTRLAQVYVGDASSQIYEFLREPRPCLFLDPRGVAWQGDESYRHWRMGRVVKSLENLIGQIDDACVSQPRYCEAQRAEFGITFDGTPKVSSARAAAAIAALGPRSEASRSQQPNSCSASSRQPSRPPAFLRQGRPVDRLQTAPKSTAAERS